MTDETRNAINDMSRKVYNLFSECVSEIYSSLYPDDSEGYRKASHLLLTCVYDLHRLAESKDNTAEREASK